MPSARAAPEPSGWEAPAGSRRGWLGVLAAAVLVAAAVAVATVERDGDGLAVDEEPSPSTPSPEPTPSPAPEPTPAWDRVADAAGTWATLPPAPIGPRVEPVVVWTGEGQGYAPRARGEVLVWGGHRGLEGLADGAAYDPFRGEWRRIADAPHAWRRGSTVAATWTGSELFTLVSPRGPHPPSAYVYDPVADHWREAAAPPANLRFWQAAGWTSEEVVLLAFARDLRTHRAAAYDPEVDRWRRLPPARVLADEGALLAASLPAGLAVFGEAQGQPAVTLLAPDADTWTAPDPLPNGTADVARPLLGTTAVDPVAGRLLLVGITANDPHTRRVWSWSPAEGWAEHPPLRADGVEGRRTAAAWGGGRLLVWFGEGAQAGAVLDAGNGGWRPMAPPPLTPRSGAGMAWTGRALVVWGGQDGEEVLGDGATFLPWSGLSEGRLRAGG